MHNRLLWITLIALILRYLEPMSYAQRVIDQGLVIKVVTLISPERTTPVLHADVVLRDAKIAEIGTNLVPGPRARQIHGSGRFLIPGLIDSHVHVSHSAALDEDAIDAHPELWAAYRMQVPRAYLSFGSTSVVDLDLSPNDRDWFERAPLHPRLYSCGKGIKVAGGYVAFKLPGAQWPNFPNLVYEPNEAEHWPKSLDPVEYSAERAVSRSAGAGAICVKAFVEPGFGMFHWPYLHAGTLQKIQAAAKAHNLVMMVHANSVDSWQSALDARVEVIAHGLWVWPGDIGNSLPPPSASKVISAAAHAGTHV